MNTYGVIMAGGGGTRFWPLSRKETPKQLLNLTGNDLMINEAVDRLATVADKDNIFIVTIVSQVPPMLKATKDRVKADHVLSEPSARNTAACIGYAAMEIVRKYGDGVMIITPADHYIKDEAGFTNILKAAVKTAEETGKLITIGINPTFASSGFGYIRYNKNESGDAKTVIEFKEKPDEETAKEYVASGEYAWNSGMFAWKAGVILDKFKEYIPDIYADLEKIGDAMNTDKEKEIIEEVYPNIRKISVDYAVMEKAAALGDVLVVPGEMGWNDVGSFDMMEVLRDKDADGNITEGDVVAVDTKDSIILSKGGKTITAVDVEGLVIVETDDAIMVCPKDKAQSVKKIVEALQAKGRNELL
ncbi:MAG: NTP transferase domain-containing protein [Lachnospiraceae bacterium]|nr:NTP transferase domain-containing protein [Lachnospiraceae bacterium]